MRAWLDSRPRWQRWAITLLLTVLFPPMLVLGLFLAPIVTLSMAIYEAIWD